MGIYGQCGFGGILENQNLYISKELHNIVGYLMNGRVNGVDGNSGNDANSAAFLDSSEMKNVDESLNDYIESKGEETKGWAKWEKVEDGYPILNYKTIWNGSEWETN